MSTPGPEEMRIGDSERESALHALGEHMSVGRLDVNEYGDRSAKVSTAKTVGELRALFTDLPAPHPQFGTSPTATAVAKEPPNVPQPAGRDNRQVSQRVAAAAMPLAAIAAVALFFVTGTWVWFLLPAAVAVLGGALWGDDWHDRKHHHHGHGPYRNHRRRDRW